MARCLLHTALMQRTTWLGAIAVPQLATGMVDRRALGRFRIVELVRETARDRDRQPRTTS